MSTRLNQDVKSLIFEFELQMRLGEFEAELKKLWLSHWGHYGDDFEYTMSRAETMLRKGWPHTPQKAMLCQRIWEEVEYGN